ncbi:kunitz-type elastase inhibitor BrEI [Trifolium repens]|nr:kunitz-type elastase inhibitor BrEI [Trifolium repens]
MFDILNLNFLPSYCSVLFPIGGPFEELCILALHLAFFYKSGDHSYDIYSFKLYPSVFSVICAPVGTFVDADGTKVLVVGASIDEPYYITESCIRQMGRRFQEVMSEWIVKLNNIEIDDSSAIYQTNSLS